MSTPKNLTPRQSCFVDEYLVDLNATEAATRAGYSARTAGVQGPRLLGNVRISERISARLAERAEKVGVTAERVVQEVARLGFSDLGEVAEWNREFGVRFKASDEISEDARRAIQSVKSRTTRRVDEDENEFETVELEVKLYPKDPSLMLLAKHLGMLVERHEVKLPPGAGVLAVPVAPDAAQWSAIAAAQQDGLQGTKEPAK